MVLRQIRYSSSTYLMQWRNAQEAGGVVSIDIDPRSCPSSGAAACTYWRWFRRSTEQQQRLGGSLHTHAPSSARAHQLLRFRLGCHGLPCVMGRRTGTPRNLRYCQDDVGDETFGFRVFGPESYSCPLPTFVSRQLHNVVLYEPGGTKGCDAFRYRLPAVLFGQ